VLQCLNLNLKKMILMNRYKRQIFIFKKIFSTEEPQLKNLLSNSDKSILPSWKVFTGSFMKKGSVCQKRSSLWSSLQIDALMLLMIITPKWKTGSLFNLTWYLLPLWNISANSLTFHSSVDSSANTFLNINLWLMTS